MDGLLLEDVTRKKQEECECADYIGIRTELSLVE